MTHLDDQEEKLLQAARRAFSPEASDAERVLAATRTAVAMGDAASAAPAPLAAAASTWLARTAIGLVIAVVGGVIGYQIGFRAGEGSSATSRPPAAPTATGDELPKGPASTPKIVPTSTAGIAEDVRALPPAPALEPVAGRASRTPTASRRTEPASTTQPRTPASPTPEASLEEELRVLREVERALRDRDPRLALQLMAELDRDVPGGHLQEERAAAFAVARCALGSGSPEVIVRDYAKSHPNSMYLARVTQACPSSPTE